MFRVRGQSRTGQTTRIVSCRGGDYAFSPSFKAPPSWSGYRASPRVGWRCSGLNLSSTLMRCNDEPWLCALFAGRCAPEVQVVQHGGKQTSCWDR